MPSSHWASLHRCIVVAVRTTSAWPLTGAGASYGRYPMSCVPTLMGCKREAGRRSDLPDANTYMQEGWPRQVRSRQLGAVFEHACVGESARGKMRWGIICCLCRTRVTMPMSRTHVKNLPFAGAACCRGRPGRRCNDSRLFKLNCCTLLASSLLYHRSPNIFRTFFYVSFLPVNPSEAIQPSVNG